jgi:hypothetical protein
MRGSWSIKRVIPTIAPELDYANLDIVSEGSQAQIAFMEMIEADENPERKEESSATGLLPTGYFGYGKADEIYGRSN